MFPGQCGNAAFFLKGQPDQFHFKFRGISFSGKSFCGAHEVSTCKISGCLSYRSVVYEPDGTETTLTFISQSDDYWLSNGMQAHPFTAKSALGQVGFRLRQNITTHSGMQFIPWLKIALEQEFVHNNPVRVNDDNFNNDSAGTRGSNRAGISATLTPHTHIYANINYEKGDGMESPWTGNASLSYRF